eukprot:CAMPEP_0202892952 /NCGR_PEP_ID=MMETSP1392-20130828/2613_1 /ASSEMBLY_ACC=CAM_ASM_000868 /TAXON_ID=225041 /ORGANISM="Chlamydomonas chlamydogama, Strain SAG 11-48b" /LENGTH=72 /DNA_ID=CAMNT_0049577097 /DNA_START=578 /DNA_END=796 /DNA_ORIENTATION=-
MERAIAEAKLAAERATEQAITDSKLEEERTRSEFRFNLLRQQCLVVAFFVLCVAPDSLAVKCLTLLLPQVFK